MNRAGFIARLLAALGVGALRSSVSNGAVGQSSPPAPPPDLVPMEHDGIVNLQADGTDLPSGRLPDGNNYRIERRKTMVPNPLTTDREVFERHMEAKTATIYENIEWGYLSRDPDILYWERHILPFSPPCPRCNGDGELVAIIDGFFRTIPCPKCSVGLVGVMANSPPLDGLR